MDESSNFGLSTSVDAHLLLGFDSSGLQPLLGKTGAKKAFARVSCWLLWQKKPKTARGAILLERRVLLSISVVKICRV